MSNTYKDFQGIEAIKDPFKYKIAENLIKNELGGVSNGYMISHAGTGNSGWSFGGHQMDLGSNDNAKIIMKDILDHVPSAL